MSYELHVSMRRTDLPPHKKWQSGIASRGFPLLLDDFEWENHQGFLPATYNGIDSGFELYLDSVEDVVPPDRLPPDHDVVVGFRVGSRLDELRCAMCSALVLVDLSGGIAWDDYSGGLLSREALETQAREAVSAEG